MIKLQIEISFSCAGRVKRIRRLHGWTETSLTIFTHVSFSVDEGSLAGWPVYIQVRRKHDHAKTYSRKFLCVEAITMSLHLPLTADTHLKVPIELNH